MKHIIILGDGMADQPLEELGGKTPLMAANTPYIDELARKGRNGLLITVPSDMPAGSEIANMGVMGYDVKKVYDGRGVLEAASMGVEIQEGDLALRCNLLCIEHENIKNHSAGHISTEEASQLIEALNEKLGSETVTFYPGVSYRHLLVIKGGNKKVKCTPPHDVPDAPWRPLLVQALEVEAEATASQLNELIVASHQVLAEHPVNLKRKAEGKDPANSIWPWSPGYKPQMPTLKEMYGVQKSAVISAVDLIQGIGVYAGMEVLKVEGATGLYDTNYEGKAEAAINALKSGVDLVYLHIEASDEAGHEGDVTLKTKTIEYLDQRIVKAIVEAAGELDDALAIGILPDHPTPCALRTHTHDPIPFIIYRPGETPDGVERYDEVSAASGSYGVLKNNEFIKALLGLS
ncbi:cofactor-independent phosphoglycerate mutase [Roseimarinus sediminis]|uniref:cofactor-independent phosphoglycerate mutase n=1 Tax=Roseimarinus sediminis TaxID=1610899 RepID=UPI003D22E3C9